MENCLYIYMVRTYSVYAFCPICALFDISKCHTESSRGPPRRVSAYEISKSTGFHVDFGFQIGFLYFTWISGFLDFEVDFLISKWISGFQSRYFKVDLDFWAGHMAYKYMHDK